jgi:hypothetical protein
MLSEADIAMNLFPKQEAVQVLQHVAPRRTLLVTMCSDEAVDVASSDIIRRKCV